MFGILALLLVVSPPHFRADSGWHVGSSPARPCVDSAASRCVEAWGWASTVRFRDCANCVPPHRTLAHLPPNGVVIQMRNARERPSRLRTGTWPPRIKRQDVQPGFEGVPARYGSFQFAVRTGQIERSLVVWFGRAHPTRRQLAQANAELRTGR